MPRWSAHEQQCIDHVREKLAKELAESPQFPEVVGDRKIIRFLRGHDYHLEKVCGLMKKFLHWRKDHHVNEYRTNIIENGFDHPKRFPKGELIQTLIPQLVIAPDAMDDHQCPICVDQYNFTPSELIKKMSIEDYVVFVTYCLEYRSLILEQLSEEREQAYLATLTPEQRATIDSKDSELPPYGYLAYTCVIRDLAHVGFEHLGSKGQEIIKTVVSIASDNYPELMRKTFMINTPWIFNTVWYFIKGLIAQRTVNKISIMGSSFIDEISKEIPKENLPTIIGGEYVGYMEYVSFPFNKAYLCPHLSLQTPANEEFSVPLQTPSEYEPHIANEVDTPIDLTIHSLSLTSDSNATFIEPTSEPTSGPTSEPTGEPTTTNSSPETIDVDMISLRTVGY